jgi:uncharacterized protein YfdQ (DUF2303 family)
VADGSFVEAIALLARDARVLHTVGGVAVTRLGKDERVEAVAFEKHQPAPSRMRGLYEFRDIASFGLYVEQHAVPFGNQPLVLLDAHGFTCIFNHHGTAGPGWGDYRAVFTPKWTRGWTAWTGFQRKSLSQDDFAQFLDNRIGEIAEPDGALVIEAVRNLQFKVDVTYERVVRTDNDTINLIYQEDLTHTGQFKLPARLELLVAPFEGADAVVLTARLTVSKPEANGKVKFSFDLGERVEEILDQADADMAARVTEMTGFGVLRGRVVKHPGEE